ncbi:Hsp33 family molecular chaperone HslO [Croceibacterium atlanticum]|nr:Hsp33 family molecular chaperone HslO [Croceibacterium atlanticum]
MESKQAGFDRILGFSIPEHDARGRIVRLGPVLDEILGAHDYPPALKNLLSEALVLCALMGGLLKRESSQLTMQAQTKGGVVELLVCDFRDGELRGYLKHDQERFDQLGADTSLETLFGEGYLAITFDIAELGERYQGIVPLEGDSLTSAVEHYFERSEQVPTLFRTAVRGGPSGYVAGGMLVQHMADGEEGGERLQARADHPEWEHVSIMAGSIRDDELVDQNLQPEEIVWRLFHEESQVRVVQGAQLSRGCRCSTVHFEQVLARFPKEDRRDMQDENGIILVDCAFCSREFPIQD